MHAWYKAWIDECGGINSLLDLGEMWGEAVWSMEPHVVGGGAACLWFHLLRVLPQRDQQ